MTVNPSRKSRLKHNMGGTERVNDTRFSQGYFDGPQNAELRTSIVLPERLLRAVLLSEVDRLTSTDGAADLLRFFSHFFDPTLADTKERDSWIADFKRTQPKVVLGYPKTTSDWPIFSITLAEETEAEAPLSRYVGETMPGERPPDGQDAVYEGSFWDGAWSVMVLAQNCDQCIYLYHFAKFCLFGARTALEAAGMIDLSYSGAEVNPQEYMLPDNSFARQLMVRAKVVQTVPQLQTYRDATKMRLGGIFSDDVVVDGLRGGVHADAHADTDPTNDE